MNNYQNGKERIKISYSEDDFLMLSGLQHFVFCRRQWALIHIEQQWEENERTVDGMLMHKNAHNPEYHSKRGDTITFRALKIHSRELGLSGECDIVEFISSPDGITLQGYEGTWRPYPVEYKRGTIKDHDADIMQLCAQAICLEEMLCCSVPEGALYYGENRRRQEIEFDADLRKKVISAVNEMHDLYQKGYTPKVRPTKSCNACSLKNLCVPKLLKKRLVSTYLKQDLEEDES